MTTYTMPILLRNDNGEPICFGEPIKKKPNGITKAVMQNYNDLIKVKTWTKRDCQKLAKALNALRFTSTPDFKREYLIQWKKRFDAAEKEYSITKEHSQQGINYLRNYCFTTKGAVRKSCQLGRFEQGIVRNFSKFRFVGYYTEYSILGDAFYHIIYRCYAKDGTFFDYCPIHWGHPFVVYTNYNTKG